MAYFLSKLVPPRKAFAVDMSTQEASVMHAHFDFWLPHVNAGIVIAMGPVADPAGDWGVAIVNSPSLAWLEKVQAEDPAILSRLGFRYENFSMPAVRVAPVEPLAPVNSVTP